MKAVIKTNIFPPQLAMNLASTLSTHFCFFQADYVVPVEDHDENYIHPRESIPLPAEKGKHSEFGVPESFQKLACSRLGLKLELRTDRFFSFVITLLYSPSMSQHIAQNNTCIPPLSSCKASQNPRVFVYGREGGVVNLAPPCLALIHFLLKQKKANFLLSPILPGGWHSDPCVLQQIVLFHSFNH